LFVLSFRRTSLFYLELDVTDV